MCCVRSSAPCLTGTQLSLTPPKKPVPKCTHPTSESATTSGVPREVTPVRGHHPPAAEPCRVGIPRASRDSSSFYSCTPEQRSRRRGGGPGRGLGGRARPEQRSPPGAALPARQGPPVPPPPAPRPAAPPRGGDTGTGTARCPRPPPPRRSPGREARRLAPPRGRGIPLSGFSGRPFTPAAGAGRRERERASEAARMRPGSPRRQRQRRRMLGGRPGAPRREAARR